MQQCFSTFFFYWSFIFTLAITPCVQLFTGQCRLKWIDSPESWLFLFCCCCCFFFFCHSCIQILPYVGILEVSVWNKNYKPCWTETVQHHIEQVLINSTLDHYIVACWYIGGFRGGDGAPPFFLVFSKCFRILLWKSFYKMLFNSIFLNVNATIYFASRIRPQCCKLHDLKTEVFIRGVGWGGRGALGPLFLNFLYPPLYIVWKHTGQANVPVCTSKALPWSI